MTVTPRMILLELLTKTENPVPLDVAHRYLDGKTVIELTMGALDKQNAIAFTHRAKREIAAIK